LLIFLNILDAPYLWIFVKGAVELVDPETRNVWITMPFQSFVQAVKTGRLTVLLKCKLVNDQHEQYSSSNSSASAKIVHKEQDQQQQQQQQIGVESVTGFFDMFSVHMDSLLYVLTQTVKHFFVNNSEYKMETVTMSDEDLKLVPREVVTVKRKQQKQQDSNSNKDKQNSSEEDGSDSDSDKAEAEARRQKLAKLEKIGQLTQGLKEMGHVMNDGLNENNNTLDLIQYSVDENQHEMNKTIRNINKKL